MDLRRRGEQKTTEREERRRDRERRDTERRAERVTSRLDLLCLSLSLSEQRGGEGGLAWPGEVETNTHTTACCTHTLREREREREIESLARLNNHG